MTALRALVAVSVGAAVGAAGGYGAWRLTTPRPAATAPQSIALQPTATAPVTAIPRPPAGDAAKPAPSATSTTADEPEPTTLEEQRAQLFARMRTTLDLPVEAARSVQAIFEASPVLGQGNPVISTHPMSRAACRKIRADAGLAVVREPACGAPNMVPLFDPERGQTKASARVCIDQFEFPNMPCEYPVVHVRAREAALICRAIGKRICDAHEWEGACAGALHDADTEYAWGRPRMEASALHNQGREKVWSYGREQNQARCATASAVTAGCPGGGWTKCGSNTYPAGAFPACQSRFGAFDLHGNVAEHMSLPVVREELAKSGDRGFTEMKGSWFIFAATPAHEDDCRWRAPAWHETRLMSEGSHVNYHLGFRCCKDVGESP